MIPSKLSVCLPVLYTAHSFCSTTYRVVTYTTRLAANTPPGACKPNMISTQNPMLG